MSRRSRSSCDHSQRRPRHLVAILAAVGIGLTTLAAGLAPSSPVAAIEISNADGFGFLNPRTATAITSEQGRVRLQMEWAVPAGTVAGDTIRQILPPSLRELSIQSFPVFDDVGRKIAESSLEQDAATGDAFVVFTFTSVVESGGSGATGDAEFTMAIDRRRLIFVNGTTTIDVYGAPVQVTQAPSEVGTRKVGAWSPNRNTAMAVDADGRLVQPDSHQLWSITFRNDTTDLATDDWTTATITEPALDGFQVNCTRNTGAFLNGFRLQVFNSGNGEFVSVPRPSPGNAAITAATCNPDGSFDVSVTKPAADVDRQYRVQYFMDLDQLDGRPVHTDANGAQVVGFPDFYRNDAQVTVGSAVRNLSTSIVGQSGRAVGRLINEPLIDIEKHSCAWEGVLFDAENNPLVTAGPDFEPTNQPPCDEDTAPGVELDPDLDQAITFTVTNIGTEPLINIVVSDDTDSGTPITGVDCVFADGSTGTAWAGPLPRTASFDCVGTLPALGGNAVYAGPATVAAAGEISGIAVIDADPWHAFTVQPDIDIENFSGTWDGVVFTGGVPTLDVDGQPVPQPTDDFDTGKLGVDAGQTVPVRFVVTNTGTAVLTDVVVTDVSGAGPSLTGVSCSFPDGSTGTTWLGPFEAEASFACTATMPALAPGESHQNLARVTANHAYPDRFVVVEDNDAWGAEAPPTPTTTTTTTTTTPPAVTTTSTTSPPSTAAPTTPTTPTPTTPAPTAPIPAITAPPQGLPATGSEAGGLALWATVSVLIGAAFILASRRRRVS